MSSSGSLPTPVGPYWYENLGEDEFQKLCHVLIAGKYDSVTCYPVGQKDGGRDITQKTDAGGVVYQVKWSKDPVKNPLTWLEKAITGESDSIKARVKAGSNRYVLMTSVSGTAAAATGPNDYGAGTIDKLDTALAGYATEYGLDSMECWWRDDIDALVSLSPRSALWRFQKMLAGPEAMRFLLAADEAESIDSKLALLVRKAVQAQWWQDVKVKFKQAELDNTIWWTCSSTSKPIQIRRGPWITSGTPNMERIPSAQSNTWRPRKRRSHWCAANLVRANRLWANTFADLSIRVRT